MIFLNKYIKIINKILFFVIKIIKDLYCLYYFIKIEKIT